MPLTRHLYREDEVEAALQFTILRGRNREAAFWCLEMLDSGLADQLLRALKTIWVLGFGAKSLGWWREYCSAAAAEALDPDRFVELAVGLSLLGHRGGRDATAVALLCRAAEKEGRAPERPGLGVACAGEGELERAFVLCLAQGRAAAAWWMGRALSAERRAVLLEAVAKQRHGTAEGVQCVSAEGGDLAAWETFAIQCATVCLPRDVFAASLAQKLPPIPAEIQEELEDWKGVVGRRQRRALVIPIDCLYWVTARGREGSVYDSNEKELLRWRFARPQALWGSGYWDTVAEEFGGWEAIAEGAEAQEAFYDREFPDDIPDEWSKAERAKSHGGGVLQRGCSASPMEWLRRWFGPVSSAVVWDGVGLGIRALRERGVPEELSPAADALWGTIEEIPAAVASGWTLRPLLRKIIG